MTHFYLCYNQINDASSFEIGDLKNLMQFEHLFTVFDHNKGLCVDIEDLPHSKKGHKIILIIIISFFTTLFLSFMALPLSLKIRKNQTKVTSIRIYIFGMEL